MGGLPARLARLIEPLFKGEKNNCKDLGYVMEDNKSHYSCKYKWTVHLDVAIEHLNVGANNKISKVHEGFLYENSDIPTFQNTYFLGIVIPGYDTRRYVCNKKDKVYDIFMVALRDNMDTYAVLNYCYTTGKISFADIIADTMIKLGPDLSTLQTYYDYTIICNDSSILCHLAVLATVPFFDILFQTNVGDKSENMSQIEVPYNKKVVESAIAFVYGDKQKFLSFSGSIEDLGDLSNLLRMWFPERKDLAELNDLIQPK